MGARVLDAPLSAMAAISVRILRFLLLSNATNWLDERTMGHNEVRTLRAPHHRHAQPPLTLLLSVSSSVLCLATAALRSASAAVRWPSAVRY